MFDINIYSRSLLSNISQLKLLALKSESNLHKISLNSSTLDELLNAIGCSTK